MKPYSYAKKFDNTYIIYKRNGNSQEFVTEVGQGITNPRSRFSQEDMAAYLVDALNYYRDMD